jgi:hypothetical protein
MNNLTPKQQKSITLLAQGMLGKEVAKEVSVTPQTLSGWKNNPEYLAALNNYRFELLEGARTQLQFAPSKAASVLIDLMEYSDSDETRRKAALDILRLTGFEPGHHETYGWGIGYRDAEQVEHDLNGTIGLFNLLK